jgi:drug/metabolite transporter (DMT)-like permease
MARRHLLMLLTLAAIWGASFMFIKVGVRGGLAPSTLVLLRLVLGALTLAPIVLLRVGAANAWRQLRSAAGALLLTGAVNSAIPIWSLSWAETRIDSGLAAVIQASAPLFTALLALAFVRSERVRGARLGGLLVGFAGVALLVGAQPHGKVTAGLAVVFSAVCYAIAALYAARALRHVSPLVTALGALTGASLLMLPGGVAQWPTDVPSAKVLASVAVLGVIGTGLAYVLYYALLAGPGASYSILVTYLVPAIALGYGVALLGEPLTVAAVAGLALVLLGVALGTGTLRLRRPRVAATETPA